MSSALKASHFKYKHIKNIIMKGNKDGKWQSRNDER